MNIKQSLTLALKSLMSSKLRSFLTMLGIIIGVASVIILVSLVDGMNRNIVKNFESMGSNLITITITGRGGNRTVTADQIQKLADDNKDSIKAISPTINLSNITAKYQNDNLTTTCIGTNELYTDISNVPVASGRYIQYTDVEQRQKVCVIGSYIASELFSGVNPIGKELKINGGGYTIVGVAQEKASSAQSSQDDRVYIPYTVARYITPNSFIGSYVISAATKDTMTKAQAIVENYLYSIYNDENAYRTMNQADQLSKANDITGKMSLILVGIAGISLLVGGIGIMNIMLVSVTERTREIGIRKSIGATPWDIMSQFVVEAITTSSIGGVLGIVLGVAVAFVLGAAMQLDTSPSFMAIFIAFSVSAAIGITFGYFPAKKASRLNPIDALRYE